MYEIVFYKDSRGREPVKEFLSELEKQADTNKDARIQLEKILAHLDALSEKGTRAGEAVTKHIDGDIWELRPVRNRILYFFWKNNTFVLLHHFVKRTQKTPTREISRAKHNMEDFLERVDDR